MRVVIAARGYNEAKGGHMVLHKLCDSLLRQGIDAYLRPHAKHWALCDRYYSQVTDHCLPDDLVIYHNSISGNPWKARHFARWMLYTPTRDTDGILLYYSEQFGPGPYLRVTDPRLDLFFDHREPRSGTCWTYRKAEHQGIKREHIEERGTEIPRGLPPQTLASIFNQHQRFVCYDGASFLAVQAALCGCDVIVPEPVGGTFPYPGIATCQAEIDRARSEREQLRSVMTQEWLTQDEKAAEVIRWCMGQR